MKSSKSWYVPVRQCVAAGLLYVIVWSQATAQTPGFLKLSAVEGEGSFNDIKRKVAHPPTVRVLDESNNPVRGATVTFTLPMVGASGVFETGGTSATSSSDEKGLAAAPSYKPNSEEGRFNIRVTASAAGKTGSLVISQSNTLAGGASVVEKSKQNNGKIWLITLLGAGGAAGAIVALRGGSKSTPAGPSPTTLSTGAITVGAPR